MTKDSIISKEKEIAILSEMVMEEHSKAQKEKIAAYVYKDKKRIDALMHLFFFGDNRMAQRVSWPISEIFENKPSLMESYIPKMYHNMVSKDDHHPAIYRNTMRILADARIPSSLESEILDVAIEYIMTPATLVAPRIFAITVAFNIAKKHKELSEELINILEEQMEFPQTAGFKSRSKKTLKALRKIVKD